MNYFLFGCFSLLAFSAYAQDLSLREKKLETLIQERLLQQDLPLDEEEWQETLYHYYLSPLDLNKASREDLEGLSLLSPAELQSFFEHLRKYGPLVSVYELQAIKDWEVSTIRKLLPFVVVGEKFDKEKFFKRIRNNSNHSLSFRTDRILQRKKGFISDEKGERKYLGTPYRHIIRYRNSVGRDFSIGLVMEKDAGEQMVWDPSRRQYLMDYWSFHFCLFNKGKWKAIAVGDYKLQFGQGLVFGGGFYIGKSSETIFSVKRNARGILPHGSVAETGFFRGVGGTYAVKKNMEITFFYSANRWDAGLYEEAETEEERVSSFKEDGMHRSQEELATRKNMKEQVTGGNITFKTKNHKLYTGLSWVYTVFDKTIREKDRLYNRFHYSGDRQTVASADYRWIVRNVTFFGEAALAGGGGKALLAGAIGSFSPKVDGAFLYRNYERNFHSFYARAFSESTDPVNEKGFYWGLRIKPDPKWTISAYYDRFVFPWLKYLRDSPSEGYGYMARVQYSRSKKTQLYVQLRCEEIGKNQAENKTPMDYTVPTVKYNTVLNLDHGIERLSLRSRVQWSSYRQTNTPTRGFAIVQDIQFDFHKVRISARYSLFETEDYDNRQYIYEKEVLYAVSFPAYYGKGSRAYCLLQFRTGRHLDWWFRYSVTYYSGQTSVGTGWETIIGDKVREIKVQVRYRFGGR